MVYKAPLETEVFWILYQNCCKFYSTNLLAFIGSKQGETMKFVSPKRKDWMSIQLLTLSFLTFLCNLPRCQVIFQWKQIKEKLENALKVTNAVLKICRYLWLYIKMLCRRFCIISALTFWIMRTRDTWNDCLQTCRNNRIC